MFRYFLKFGNILEVCKILGYFNGIFLDISESIKYLLLLKYILKHIFKIYFRKLKL